MESQDVSITTPSESKYDFENNQFTEPKKRIVDMAALEQFKKSEACQELLGFIAALQ